MKTWIRMEIRLYCGVGGKMGSNKYGNIKRILDTRNSMP